MRVVLAGSALPGLRPSQTLQILTDAWQAERPGDTLDAFAVSDGAPQPYVGSGLDDVLASGVDQESRGEGSERRFAYFREQAIIIDYSDVFAGLPREGSLTSAIVGEDLLWAAKRASHVIVALPHTGCIADGGIAMVQQLATGTAPRTRHGDAYGQGIPARQDLIARWVRAAREALRGLSITVLAPAEQQLVGFGGVARAWMVQGLPADLAQAYEKELGSIAALLADAGAESQSLGLLSTPPSARDVYSGVGGIGFALSVLGARIYPVGDLTVRPQLGSVIEQADLVVYACGAIGEDLPSGLAVAINEARRVGCAIVVIYETGSLRKGELARLGIHGAYALREGFSDGDTRVDGIADVAERLATVSRSVAHTWGWDPPENGGAGSGDDESR